MKLEVFRAQYKRVMKELKTEYAAYFESQLAIRLLEDIGSFSSVKKISQAILDIIENNKNDVVAAIESSPKVANDLYDKNLFGHLIGVVTEKTSDEVISDICSVLNQHSQSNKIMHIHSVFIYRVYNYILQNYKAFSQKSSQKKHHVKTLFDSELFPKNRSRQACNDEPSASNQLGISRNKVFEKRNSKSKTYHRRAVERFTADETSSTYKVFERNNIPFVAGPSGHTGSFILGALLYGDLNPQEFNEYCVAIFTFLTCAGAHSFFEVMMVVDQIKPETRTKQYSDYLPQTFFHCKSTADLRTRFPEFLSEYNSCDNLEAVDSHPLSMR